jgi:type I restriction enzyme S subunit
MKNDWQTQNLGDVCGFEGGSQPPKSQFIYEEKPGYVRFLQIRDFGNEKNITFIPESKKNRYCVENDILIGRYGASVGKILTKKAGAYNVALLKTIPNLKILDQSWFYNYLLSDEFQNRLSKVADRSAQAGFSKEDIYNFPVPIPPHHEQKRIVGILNEAFKCISAGKANAEKNLQNARDLFKSHLNAAFSQCGGGWAKRILAEILKLEYGKPLDESDRKSSGLHPIYGANGEIGRTDKFYWNKPSIIVGRKGSAGELNLTESKFWPLDVTYFVTFDEQQYDLRFLYYLLTTLDLPRFAKGVKPGINRNEVYSEIVKTPLLLEQRQIVERLDILATETRRLEAIYQDKLAALEELKKSLLHQAFSGNL